MSGPRVVRWVVTPVIVFDDGEHLDELDVAPITIPARHWEQFAAQGWRDALAELERSLSEPPATDA